MVMPGFKAHPLREIVRTSWVPTTAGFTYDAHAPLDWPRSGPRSPTLLGKAVNHVLAILGFAALCALLFLVQRWAGRGDEAPCDSCETPGCANREPGDP